MTETVGSLLPMIGQRVLVKLESVRVSCMILDAKYVYGNQRYLVHPVNGQGQMWVDAARITSELNDE